MQFITEFGLIAGLAGLGLGVFAFLYREVIRKKIFPVLTKKQGFQVIIIFMALVWSIAIYCIYGYLNPKPVPIETSSQKIELNNEGVPYEYSCKEVSEDSQDDFDLFAEDLEEDLDYLNTDFDYSLITQDCDKSLINGFIELEKFALSSIETICERKENKNFENLQYLKYNVLVGTYYRLAYLSANCNDTTNIVKYSKLALESVKEGKKFMELSSELSPTCRSLYNIWIIKNKHDERIPVYELFSMVINYQYDAFSKVEKNSMLELINDQYNFLDLNYRTDLQYYGIIVGLIKEEASLSQKFIEFDGFN